MTLEPDDGDRKMMERYREASLKEGAAPSASTRAAILAEGRRVAASRDESSAAKGFDTRRSAADPPRWWLAAAGSLALAGLAAFLVLPRVWEAPNRHRVATSAPPQFALPGAAPSAPADARRSEAKKALTQTQSVPSAPLPRAAAPALATAAGAQSRGARLESDSSLASAVAAGNVRQAAELLEKGADSRQPDPSGRPPLLLAVIEQRPDLVRLLLAHGADPNARDQAGETPLERARRDGRADIASLLEAAGARQR